MVTKVKLNKSELNKQIYSAINEIYGEYLRQHTFVGKITQRKIQTANQWDISIDDFLVFRFSNPNFFDIKMQEEGIEPQIIKAKNKKYLRFKKPMSRKSKYQKIPGNIAFENQGYIYAKMIRHPGFEGRRFIAKMLTDNKLFETFGNKVNKYIKNLINDKVSEVTTELNKIQ